MDFTTAWTTFNVDDYVAVSDGNPEPSIVRGRAWFVWRSHNFVGCLKAKEGEAPNRTMRFELASGEGATVSYTIREAGGHDFTASTFEVFSNG